MDEGKQQEIRQWLIKSQRDLGAARVLLESDDVYPDIAAYHCQQAVEKAIKGYLTYHDVLFQKTHDLNRLLALCSSQNEEFSRWRTMAAMLTPYATEFRYPGNVVEPKRDEAEQAIELATAFVNFVMQQLLSD
ncbi:MAG: HEPN domain-containing protein [Leptolyngbyaceae cyanobacterium SL_7_1]|nr:HEPN domain-containing protein [Leptolyngbyaceae cyanobacterium SL_7_1]